MRKNLLSSSLMLLARLIVLYVVEFMTVCAFKSIMDRVILK